jgi:lipopolysaccharide biosynthesis protein/uncharacterized coiled-coil DUF342 family protein
MNSLFVNKENQKRIVVVLGMHRSGTSLLTRGLQVLGVDLGSNLYGGIIGNNDKGFFEDVDVNEFNVEFLKALGRDWHSIEPVLLEEFNAPVVHEFKLRAIQLLRNKVKNTQCFGLKDPRIAKLMPFWLSVFNHLKMRVSYVIAFRNPMSVARSLQRRDGFDLEKGYLLWGEHMLNSLSNTYGCERLVVDYDRLVAKPEEELQRIAEVFSLPFEPTSKEFIDYKTDFLDSSLRHTEFQADDLSLEQAAPPATLDLYELLVSLSEDIDTSNFDAVETKYTLEQLTQTLTKSHNLLRYLSLKDAELSTLRKIVDENEGKLGGLQQTVAERNTHIDSLNRAVTQRDSHIASLNEAVAQYEDNLKTHQSELDSLESQLDEKESLLRESVQANSILESSLKQNGSVLERAVMQRSALESNLLLAQKKLEESNVRISELTNENADYSHKVMGLSADVEDALSHRNNLLVEVEMIRVENANYNQQVLMLSADLDVASSDRDNLLVQIEELRVEISTYNQNVLSLSADVDAALSQRDNLLIEIEERRVELRSMQLNNEKHLTEIAILEATVERNSREHVKNNEVNNNLLRLNEQLNNEVAARTQHVAHLENACAAFEYEVSGLESKLYYAWQEIESLKNANAEMRFHNERILNSSSWYLTAPLRFFRLNLMTRPYIFIKKSIVKVARSVWRSLPMSTSARLAYKSAVYKTLPFIFKNSEKYQQWKYYLDTQKTHLRLQHQETTQALSICQESAPVIPRIQFDATQNQFVEYRDNPAIDPIVKLIAFYLPQFHPFPENDAWWGKGFTEWTNVTKAYPNYVEHYQPHYPIHMGYYDLRVAETMEEQARLAKEYGIHGFSYYFYWFAGKILMDKPLEQMLANPKVDMPFCFTWANENWSRRWDGQENDILIAQHHSDEDSLNFIRHLLKYFKDDRYIKVDGKPLLIIYRASIIPNIGKTADIWREELKKNGFPGLYLVCAQSFGIKSPDEFGFDASVEFPPHTVSSTDIRHELNISNEDFNGHVFSYEQVVANAVASKEPDYKLFRAAMLSWDNTARKQNNSHIFHGFSLLRYKQWLSSITNNAFNNSKYSNDEKLVFVNAWNEWAEGTHLEPDRKFGYGYLQATYDVLAEYDRTNVARLAYKRSIRQNDCAVVLHLHYEELWGDIKLHLDSLSETGFDLYVTVTSSASGVKVAKDYPDAHIELVENRGRDILPFLKILKIIKDMGYVAVCKIHSKRSVYRQDGDKIRDELLEALLGSSAVATKIIERFSTQPTLGLVAAEKYLIPHTDHNMTFSGEVVATITSALGLDFSYDEFAAGSMFWFKPEALESILSIEKSLFEVEDGLADGTLAHGVERVFCTVVKGAKYNVETV